MKIYVVEYEVRNAIFVGTDKIKSNMSRLKDTLIRYFPHSCPRLESLGGNLDINSRNMRRLMEL